MITINFYLQGSCGDCLLTGSSPFHFWGDLGRFFLSLSTSKTLLVILTDTYGQTHTLVLHGQRKGLNDCGFVLGRGELSKVFRHCLSQFSLTGGGAIVFCAHAMSLLVFAQGGEGYLAKVHLREGAGMKCRLVEY